MSRVQQIYQAILQADQVGAVDDLPMQERPLSLALRKLAAELDGDEVLAEAVLAWVKEKKRELTLQKLVALRGQEWVNQQIAAMESQ